MNPDGTKVEKETIPQMLSTNLMQLNSCFHALKQIDVNLLNDPDMSTDNHFLQYFFLNEMKRPEHHILIESPAVMTDTVYYGTDRIGLAFVTHIADELRGICYIIDVMSMNKLHGLFGDALLPLEDLPEPQQMFTYLYHEKFLLRAVRIDQFDTQPSTVFQAYLIDVGCTITIDFVKCKRNHFMLANEVAAIPGLARKCQILNMPIDSNILDLLHERIEYKILLNDDENIFINVLKISHFDKRKGEPNFYSYLWADLSKLSTMQQNESHATIARDEIDNVGESKTIEITTTPVPADTKLAEDIEIITPVKKKSKNSRSELFKVLNNSSGNKCHDNVQKDNNELATLSQSTMNTIEKSINEQQQLLNKKQTMESISNSELPAIGETIMIRASHILTAAEFYASITTASPAGVGIEELTTLINSDDYKNDLRSYRSLKIGEKVLAFYGTEIFRAIIIVVHDKTTCQVFYYDYGNCAKINIQNLFEYDTNLDKYPRYALHFRINQIEPCSHNDVLGIVALRTILLPNTIQATIVDIIDIDSGEVKIIADLIDENDLNVAKTLANKGLAAFKK